MVVLHVVKMASSTGLVMPYPLVAGPVVGQPIAYRVLRLAGLVVSIVDIDLVVVVAQGAVGDWKVHQPVENS